MVTTLDRPTTSLPERRIQQWRSRRYTDSEYLRWDTPLTIRTIEHTIALHWWGMQDARREARKAQSRWRMEEWERTAARHRAALLTVLGIRREGRR